MSETSVVFYGLLMAIFIAEGWVLGRVLPLQRTQNRADIAGGRLLGLDGLRGLLALSVFLHHGALYYSYLHTGHWIEVPSNFYAQMGVLPVTLFFFITGFLFWSKLSRRSHIAFGPFLRERMGRLGGVYVVACLIFFLLVAVASGFHRNVSWSKLLLEIVGWFSYLAAGHDMNRIFDSKRWLGQVWTLRLEWMFYLSLPFLGWFARKRIRLAVLLGLAGGLSVLAARVDLPGFALDYLWKTIGNYAWYLSVTFSVGMVVAAIPWSDTARRLMRSPIATLISWMLLAITAFLVPARYGLAESLLLAAPFAFICMGNSWFGALISEPIRSLGRVSYSFYLLHIFALQVGIWILPHFVVVAKLAPLPYWIFVCLCGCVAVLASYLSYQFLEYPFLRRSAKNKPFQPQPAPTQGIQLPAEGALRLS